MSENYTRQMQIINERLSDKVWDCKLYHGYIQAESKSGTVACSIVFGDNDANFMFRTSIGIHTRESLLIPDTDYILQGYYDSADDDLTYCIAGVPDISNFISKYPNLISRERRKRESDYVWISWHAFSQRYPCWIFSDRGRDTQVSADFPHLTECICTSPAFKYVDREYCAGCKVANCDSNNNNNNNKKRRMNDGF